MSRTTETKADRQAGRLFLALSGIEEGLCQSKEGSVLVHVRRGAATVEEVAWGQRTGKENRRRRRRTVHMDGWAARAFPGVSRTSEAGRKGMCRAQRRLGFRWKDITLTQAEEDFFLRQASLLFSRSPLCSLTTCHALRNNGRNERHQSARWLFPLAKQERVSCVAVRNFLRGETVCSTKTCLQVADQPSCFPSLFRNFRDLSFFFSTPAPSVVLSEALRCLLYGAQRSAVGRLVLCSKRPGILAP